MKHNTRCALTSVILIFILVIMLPFSCTDSKDMREKVRDNMGEPDQVYQSGSGPYKYEQWVYDSLDVGYVFRQTAPACGSSKKGWYVDYTFLPSNPYPYYYKEVTPADSLFDGDKGYIFEP